MSNQNQICDDAAMAMYHDEYQRGIQLCTEGIQNFPENAVLYHIRALGYIGMTEYDLALRDAKKCIEIDPFNTRGWMCLSQIYEKKGERTLERLADKMWSASAERSFMTLYEEHIMSEQCQNVGTRSGEYLTPSAGNNSDPAYDALSEFAPSATALATGAASATALATGAASATALATGAASATALATGTSSVGSSSDCDELELSDDSDAATEPDTDVESDESTAESAPDAGADEDVPSAEESTESPLKRARMTRQETPWYGC